MESMQNIEPLLDAKQVKGLLHCSVALIYKLADQGRLPSVRIPCPGKGFRKKELVRFKLEDITRFIDVHYRR